MRSDSTANYFSMHQATYIDFPKIVIYSSELSRNIKIMILQTIQNLLFPKTCLVTGETGSYLSKTVLQNYLHLHDYTTCPVCHVPVRKELVHKDCKELTYLDGLLYCCTYNHLVKDIMHQGKYDDYYAVFNDIGIFMSKFLRPYFVSLSAACIVPVPLHPAKQKKRGFNQTHLIAQEISKKYQLPLLETVERTVYTETQVGMTEEARQRNVRNAFHLSSDQISLFSNCILLDDVCTTGTTLETIARIIKESHPHIRIIGCTFAKSREYR